MSKLNRSKEQARNLWLDLCSPSDRFRPKIISLQSFLTAPNNAFLARDILEKFLELKPIIEDSQWDSSPKLNEHFETAKFCLKRFEERFPKDTPEHTYLNIDSFWHLTRKKKHRKFKVVEGSETSTKIPFIYLNDKEYIDKRLWHDYIDSYPVYVSFFFLSFLRKKIFLPL